MKRAIIFIIGIPLVLLLIGIIAILTIDPNSLKPTLEENLAKQGLVADFKGDLSWQFFPNIGMSLGNIELRSQETNAQLASLGNASVSVALAPLFKREIKVNGVKITAGTLTYHIDKSGKSNWDFLIQSDSSTDETEIKTEESAPSSETDIQIDSLEILDLAFDYQDATSGTAIAIENLSVIGSQINLDGRSFPIELSVSGKMSDFPAFKLALKSQIGVSTAQSELSLSDLNIKLHLANNSTPALQYSSPSTVVNWRDSLQVKNESTLQATKLRETFAAMAIPLPEGIGDNALQKLLVNFNLTVEADSLNVDTLKLTFDETKFNGSLAVNNFAQPEINADLAGDTINLNHYIPATENDESTPEEAASTEASPLPMQALRDLHYDLKFDLAKVIYQELEINNVALRSSAKNGLLKINPFSLVIADGTMTTNAKLDATAETAKVVFDSNVDNVDVGQLIKIFANSEMLSGFVVSEINGTSHGKTSTDLIENLALTLNAESKTMRLSPINLEKSFCDAVALIDKKEPSTYEWPEYSDLSAANIKVELKQQKISLNSMDAGIQKLLANAQGDFDMKSGKFDFPIELKLADIASELEGCNIIDEKWQKRIIPLRCKGTIEDVGPSTCLPDMKKIASIVKEKAKDKAEQKVKDKLIEKLGEDKVNNLKKDLKGLKNLFK